MHPLEMVIKFYWEPHLESVFRVGALVTLREYSLVIVWAPVAVAEETPTDENGQVFFPFQDDALDILPCKEKLEDEIPVVDLVDRALGDLGQIKRIGEQGGFCLVLPERNEGLSRCRLNWN